MENKKSKTLRIFGISMIVIVAILTGVFLGAWAVNYDYNHFLDSSNEEVCDVSSNAVFWGSFYPSSTPSSEFNTANNRVSTGFGFLPIVSCSIENYGYSPPYTISSYGDYSDLLNYTLVKNSGASEYSGLDYSVHYGFDLILDNYALYGFSSRTMMSRFLFDYYNGLFDSSSVYGGVNLYLLPYITSSSNTDCFSRNIYLDNSDLSQFIRIKSHNLTFDVRNNESYSFVNSNGNNYSATYSLNFGLLLDYFQSQNLDYTFFDIISDLTIEVHVYTKGFVKGLIPCNFLSRVNNYLDYQRMSSQQTNGYLQMNSIAFGGEFRNVLLAYGPNYGNDLSDSQSYDQGYRDGRNVGLTDGYDSGYNNGVGDGYNNGYNNGFNAGVQDSNNYSFLSLMGAVVDAPIQAFTGLFNFQILGVNMKDFLAGLFTICLVIVVVRFVLVK